MRKNETLFESSKETGKLGRLMWENAECFKTHEINSDLISSMQHVYLFSLFAKRLIMKCVNENELCKRDIYLQQLLQV